MERIDVTGMLGGSVAEEEPVVDEMRELLGNRTVRCTKGLHGEDALTALHRPLYACYMHSHGEFRNAEARASLEECVGCTRWLEHVDGYGEEEGGDNGGGLKKSGGAVWQKIEL